MLKISREHQGQLVTLEHRSAILADNPLGDSPWRTVTVWLPPAYANGQKSLRRFPGLFALAGLMSSGQSMTAWRGFDENLPERAARLVADGAMDDVILVFPDCFTSLGGNQFINSSAIGNYGDYLVKELVPFVDGEFRTTASRDGRGLFGHSSGGFGALTHAMTYPDCWGAAASHAGDMHFECCYLPGWMKTLTQLSLYREPAYEPGVASPPPQLADDKRGIDDGRVTRFLAAMRDKSPDFDEGHALMDCAMAATYDPDPSAPNGFRLPFDLETGELLPERWQAWQRHDPVRQVARHADALRSLKALYFDSGWRDQYAMHFGARLLAQQLSAARVPYHYEIFNGTHSKTSYRMDVSLPLLVKAMGN
jgi:hypothetical protein